MKYLLLLTFATFLSFCAEKEEDNSSGGSDLDIGTVVDSNDIVIGSLNRYYTNAPNGYGSREHFVAIDSPKGFTYTLGIDDHVFTDFTIYSSKDRFIENGVLANVGMKETEFWSEAEYSGAHDDQSPSQYFTVVSTKIRDGINVTHLYLCRDANQTSTAGEMGIQYKFQKNANYSTEYDTNHYYNSATAISSSDNITDTTILDTLRECSYAEVGVPENIAFPLYFINENTEKEEITETSTMPEQ